MPMDEIHTDHTTTFTLPSGQQVRFINFVGGSRIATDVDGKVYKITAKLKIEYNMEEMGNG